MRAADHQQIPALLLRQAVLLLLIEQLRAEGLAEQIEEAERDVVSRWQVSDTNVVEDEIIEEQQDRPVTSQLIEHIGQILEQPLSVAAMLLKFLHQPEQHVEHGQLPQEVIEQLLAVAEGDQQKDALLGGHLHQLVTGCGQQCTVCENWEIVILCVVEQLNEVDAQFGFVQLHQDGLEQLGQVLNVLAILLQAVCEQVGVEAGLREQID